MRGKEKPELLSAAGQEAARTAQESAAQGAGPSPAHDSGSQRCIRKSSTCMGAGRLSCSIAGGSVGSLTSCARAENGGTKCSSAVGSFAYLRSYSAGLVKRQQLTALAAAGRESARKGTREIPANTGLAGTAYGRRASSAVAAAAERLGAIRRNTRPFLEFNQSYLPVKTALPSVCMPQCYCRRTAASS